MFSTTLVSPDTSMLSPTTNSVENKVLTPNTALEDLAGDASLATFVNAAVTVK